MTTDAELAVVRERGLVRGLVGAVRPKQWAKNLLLFAAPAAAGVLLDWAVAARVLVALGLWCVAAGGVYLWNDVIDLEDDRRHPTKRHRPIASGLVPVSVAVPVGAVLLGGAVVGSWLLVSAAFAFVLSLYVVLTVAYSVWLKRVVIVDLATVAAGFVLRAIGGGVAAAVEISSWFLIVASFASLFIVTGKRHAEHVSVGDALPTRAVLRAYTTGYLHFLRMTAAAVTILAYCLWAFEEAAAAPGALWYELSILPFVLGVLRYGLLLEAGVGEAPEEVVMSDRPLQLAGTVWAVLFAAGVYAG